MKKLKCSVPTIIVYKCYIEDDIFSLSLQEQKLKCDKYLFQNKLLVVREYIDTECDRPQLRQMFEDIKNYKLKNCRIIIW